MSEKVQLSKATLRQEILDGTSRAQLAKKYKLSLAQINKAITDCNFGDLKPNIKKFVLIDDEPAEPQPTIANGQEATA